MIPLPTMLINRIDFIWRVWSRDSHEGSSSITAKDKSLKVRLMTFNLLLGRISNIGGYPFLR